MDLDTNSNISSGNFSIGDDFHFEAVKIPQILETKSYDRTYYQPDKDNKWFWNCRNYYEECSLHHSIIDNLYLDITKGSNDKILDRLTNDYLIYGGFACQIRKNPLGRIVDVKYLDFRKIRAGVPNDETGHIENYYFSNNWFGYHKAIQKFPNYIYDTTTDNSIYYYHKNLQTDVYPRPYWYSARRWVYTYIEVSKFYSNLAKNNMVANKILTINTDMTEEERTSLKRSIKQHLTGGENAGSIMTIFNPGGKDYAPEIISFNNEQQDQAYKDLLDICRTEIAIGHQLPVALLGILIPGSLGNNDLEPHTIRYNDTVVQPIKQEIQDGYNIIKNNLSI